MALFDCVRKFELAFMFCGHKRPPIPSFDQLESPWKGDQECDLVVLVKNIVEFIAKKWYLYTLFRASFEKKVQILVVIAFFLSFLP